MEKHNLDIVQHSTSPSLRHPKFLIIRGGAIGDFILTLPTIGALRKQWPEARIEILGYPHIAELARGRYYADAVRSISYGSMSVFFIPRSVLDPALVEYFAGFDVVISYFYDPDGIFSANLRRCGVKSLLPASTKPSGMHAAKHFALPLEALSLFVSNLNPKIHPNDADRAAANSFIGYSEFGIRNSKLVAIHPGSGSENKNWPVDRWAKLCHWLKETKKCEILLVLGEADERVADALKPFAAKTAKNFSLPKLAAVLARCALFIGHDSGITHLAAASSTPTLALFATSDPTLWRPLGLNVRVVFREDEWTIKAGVTQLGTMAEIPFPLVQRLVEEMLVR